MKVELIKNKFFELKTILKGKVAKSVYNKNTYAFLECRGEERNFVRFFNIGEIALVYNKENNQMVIYFFKYEFYPDSYEISKFHIINSINFDFVSIKDTFKRLKSLKIDIKNFI